MKKTITFIFAISTIFVSCNLNKVEEIIIEDTLYVHRSFLEIRELRKLIRQTLNQDEKALVKLNNFCCGGAAGCYDLGFVITQIIYRIGEQEFIQMVEKLDHIEILRLDGFIRAGLEYGDNDKDGKVDNKRFEDEFPSLYILLREQKNNPVNQENHNKILVQTK